MNALAISAKTLGARTPIDVQYAMNGAGFGDPRVFANELDRVLTCTLVFDTFEYIGKFIATV